jgi:hypothetical protein
VRGAGWCGAWAVRSSLSFPFSEPHCRLFQEARKYRRLRGPKGAAGRNLAARGGSARPLRTKGATHVSGMNRPQASLVSE